MNKIALFKGRWNASLRDGWTIIILCIAVMLSVFMAWQLNGENAGHFRMGIVDYDNGEFSRSLFNQINEKYNIEAVLLSETEAEKQMLRGQLECYVVIDKDFTERLKQLDFDRLLTLHIRTDSRYSSSVTAPLMSEILKTWIEEKVLVELNRITELTMEEETDIRNRYETIWAEGSQIHIEMSPVEDTTVASTEPKKPYTWQASAWYAMLTCFYIMLSGRWMSDFRNQHFLARARQRGITIVGMFFPQTLPDIVLVTVGYLPVCFVEQGLTVLDHHVVFSWSVLLNNHVLVISHCLMFLIYAIATMGMSLLICSLCRSLVTLLFAAPFVSVFSAIYSGLIVNLPEWSGYMSTFTRALPTYWYMRLLKYDLTGSMIMRYMLYEAIIAIIWLLVSILAVNLLQRIGNRIQA